MPELAEVEFFRKRWHLAAAGERVVRVLTHDRKKLLRELDPPAFRRALLGARFESSEARAKQLLFRFSGDIWLGLHLGMSGGLTVEIPEYVPGKHDHLVIVTGKPDRRAQGTHALVFTDPRMFGRIQFHIGPEPPVWWSQIAPAILSPAFTVAAVASFLARRRRAPIKAVLLMQERFPGIGNWMADEILWRAAIHPARPAGSLTPREVRRLWRECRQVCRAALRAIAGRGNRIPRNLNGDIPRTWLFKHRWRPGGTCPRSGRPLAHATIAGRTTCWSPARQKLPAPASRRLRAPLSAPFRPAAAATAQPIFGGVRGSAGFQPACASRRLALPGRSRVQTPQSLDRLETLSSSDGQDCAPACADHLDVVFNPSPTRR